MTTFTIITTTGQLTVEGDRWARADGDVYVYPEGGDEAAPVAEVDNDEFIAIFDPSHGAYTAAT